MNQIYVNGFSLEIISPQPVTKKNINGANYYLLRHKSIYKLRLINDRATRCDAEVWVDGEKIGVWRINCRSEIVIERPAKIDRKFVFLKENSSSAKSAGITSDHNTNGLVKVIFKPERYLDHFDWYSGISSRPFEEYRDPKLSSFRSQSFQNGITQQNYQNQNQLNQLNDAYFSAAPFESSVNDGYSHGATALGQRSDQKFTSTSPIYDVDISNITTIMARLLVDENTNPHLISLRSALHTSTYPKRLDVARGIIPIYN